MDCHQYPEIYERLYKIAERAEDEGDYEFWLRYVRTEASNKARSNKVPSIDFPSKKDGGKQEVDAHDEIDSESAFSAENENWEKTSSGRRASVVRPESALQSLSMKRQITTSSIPKDKKSKLNPRQEVNLNGDELVSIYVGSGKDQKVFHLTRNDISKSSFFNELVQGNPPYIFHPFLHQMIPAEFESIYLGLHRGGDDESGFLNVRGDREDEDGIDDDVLLGDIQRVGKMRMLKEVNNLEDLSTLMSRFTTTYTQASQLGLREIADVVMDKVQVAWNIYGRVEQLPLFFDFIEHVVPCLEWNVSAYKIGGVERVRFWIVSYLAETMKHYATFLPLRFWGLMAKYPMLEKEVMMQRSKGLDAQFKQLEKEFLELEPLTERDFFPFSAQLGQEKDQESAKEEKTPSEVPIEANNLIGDITIANASTGNAIAENGIA